MSVDLENLDELAEGRGKERAPVGPKDRLNLPIGVTGPLLMVPKFCRAPHDGFIWDKVKFLHSILYGDMFWTCATRSDNTGMFSLFLSSTYIGSNPFLFLMVP